MTTTISDELRDLRRRSGPLGTEGTSWDIAWAGLFLASDESRWVSGVLLPIDAGLLATNAVGDVVAFAGNNLSLLEGSTHGLYKIS